MILLCIVLNSVAAQSPQVEKELDAEGRIRRIAISLDSEGLGQPFPGGETVEDIIGDSAIEIGSPDELIWLASAIAQNGGATLSQIEQRLAGMQVVIRVAYPDAGGVQIICNSPTHLGCWYEREKELHIRVPFADIQDGQLNELDIISLVVHELSHAMIDELFILPNSGEVRYLNREHGVSFVGIAADHSLYNPPDGVARRDHLEFNFSGNSIHLYRFEEIVASLLERSVFPEGNVWLYLDYIPVDLRPAHQPLLTLGYFSTFVQLWSVNTQSGNPMVALSYLSESLPSNYPDQVFSYLESNNRYGIMGERILALRDYNIPENLRSGILYLYVASESIRVGEMFNYQGNFPPVAIQPTVTNIGQPISQDSLQGVKIPEAQGAHPLGLLSGGSASHEFDTSSTLAQLGQDVQATIVQDTAYAYYLQIANIAGEDAALRFANVTPNYFKIYNLTAAGGASPTPANWIFDGAYGVMPLIIIDEGATSIGTTYRLFEPLGYINNLPGGSEDYNLIFNLIYYLETGDIIEAILPRDSSGNIRVNPQDYREFFAEVQELLQSEDPEVTQFLNQKIGTLLYILYNDDYPTREEFSDALHQFYIEVMDADEVGKLGY